LQAEQRKEAIQAARKAQYAQTDRAKTLQSAVLLTDVIREREAQIEYKAKKYEEFSPWPSSSSWALQQYMAMSWLQRRYCQGHWSKICGVPGVGETSCHPTRGLSIFVNASLTLLTQELSCFTWRLSEPAKQK
jgi:hypothetical protein